MNIITKWQEYNSGTLTSPCVVQYDLVGQEHIVWVWTGRSIIQTSRSSYDETEIISDIVSYEIIQTEEYEIECEDDTILNMEIPI